MRKRTVWMYLLICFFSFGQTGAAQQAVPNVITDWAAIMQPAVIGGTSTRPAGSAFVLATMIHLAMYDAAMAVEGGYQPYASSITAPAGTDVRAAVATAAARAPTPEGAS